MKKIILSVAVAAMALSTTASALEDIKVSGQAKLWYETSDTDTTAAATTYDTKYSDGSTNKTGTGEDQDLFHKNSSQANVVFKLGMTGKQGNVGFGAEMTQTSTMGLENVLVTNNRAGSGLNPAAYVSKAYFTAPIAGATLKMGRQELNTPFLFTEKWNAVQNNFDAAVVIAPVNDNLTVIAAYAGQTNSGAWSDASTDADITNNIAGWKATTNFNQIGSAGSYALGLLVKTDVVSANVWGYEVTGIAKAAWADVSAKAGPVALKAYVATMMPAASGVDNTVGFALSAGMKAGAVNLFAAATMVGEDGAIPLANVATGFKKTKLPTAGVYTDGVYIAQPDSVSFKVKASTKLGSTGITLQAVNNSNDTTASKETTEVDLIVAQKLGDFNLKGILMHRSFDLDALDDSNGGIHARVIASVNF